MTYVDVKKCYEHYEQVLRIIVIVTVITLWTNTYGM